MNAYYLTRNDGNRYFGKLKSGPTGWQTDQGYVLIIYGKPNQIQRPKTEENVEVKNKVWTFEQLSKRFVFKQECNSYSFYLITEN